jgi:hypothetical protein
LCLTQFYYNMAKKYLDSVGLARLWNKINSIFVAKEAGKGLSHNDYTDDDKAKLDSVSLGAEKNILVGVKENGVLLTPDNSRVIDISVPTKTSDIYNDSTFQTAEDVATTIVSLSLNTSTGIITATRKDGSIFTIDLPTEKVIKSGYFDSDAEEIVLVLADDSEIRFSAAELIDTYCGDDNTIELYTDTNDSNKKKFRLVASVHNKVNGAEQRINKVNTIDSSSLDTKYPSALAVWNAIKYLATNTQVFTPASSRSNIESGETIATIFGKIAKWLSDLKTVAFTGSYNDLTNKPTIPTVGGGTITIKQKGVSKGSFTVNQSSNTTIELTDENTTYGIANSSVAGLVKSGTDIAVDSSGNVSVNDDSHNHTLLQNYFYKTHTAGDFTSRPTSINVASNNLSSLRSFISGTASVVGGLSHAAHIIHHDWDNGNSWATQLALPVYDYNGIYFRCQTDKGWDTAVWKKVYTENSKPAVADITGLSTELSNYMKWSDLRDNTSLGVLGWTSKEEDKVPISSNTLAHWNGAFNSISSNLTYFGKEMFMSGAKAFRNIGDNWLRINDEKTFTNGVYFGSGFVRIDGNFRVGPNPDSALNVDQNNCTWKGVPIATDNIAACVNNTTSKYWYLMYECTLTTAYQDVAATFVVSSDFNNYSSGIIHCHIRMGNNAIELASLRMTLNSGPSPSVYLDPTAFVLAYKMTGTNVSNFRIYARVTAKYYGFTMREINHGERGRKGGKQYPWKGYTNNVDTTGGIATTDGNFVPPSGYSFTKCGDSISRVPAQFDGNGNTITSYYAPKKELSKYLPLAGGTLTGTVTSNLADYKDTVLMPNKSGFGKIGGADNMFFKGYFEEVRVLSEIELQSGNRPSGDTEDGGKYYNATISGGENGITISAKNLLFYRRTGHINRLNVLGAYESKRYSIPAEGSSNSYTHRKMFTLHKNGGVRFTLFTTSWGPGISGIEEFIIWVNEKSGQNNNNLNVINVGSSGSTMYPKFILNSDRSLVVYDEGSYYGYSYFYTLQPLTSETDFEIHTSESRSVVSGVNPL